MSDLNVHDAEDPSGGSDRPLGRGLQDISHLFLSNKPQVPAPAPALPSWSDSAVPLRPVQITKERLAALVPADWSGTLEDGLRTIDARVPCDPCGEIDVLAIDRASKLTIIDFDTAADDGMLLRGLSHFEWIVRNGPIVQRMYSAQDFDTSLPPRLILLAPHFSPLLRRAMRQVVLLPIQWFRYHAVETPVGLGMLLEAVTGE